MQQSTPTPTTEIFLAQGKTNVKPALTPKPKRAKTLDY
jgi:hypothetical protein